MYVAVQQLPGIAKGDIRRKSP